MRLSGVVFPTSYNMYVLHTPYCAEEYKEDTLKKVLKIALSEFTDKAKPVIDDEYHRTEVFKEPTLIS